MKGDENLMINAKKEDLEKIDLAFDVLSEYRSTPAIKIIESTLNKCFGYEFIVKVVDNKPETFFGMSVFPSVSTMDKIVTELMKSGDNSKVIRALWEKNTLWNIEIDSCILKDQGPLSLTNKEFTAMLLHEIGHVIHSNEVSTRVTNIVQYEISKSSMTVKAMGNDTVFKRILSLPILNACVSNHGKPGSSLKEEVKADKFVVKMGYEKDLVSVLTKLSKAYSKNGSIENEAAQIAQFSAKTLDDFQARRASLVKRSLMDVKESVVSPYIKDFIGEYITSLYGIDNKKSYITESDKLGIMYEKADKDLENYMTEFFIFKKTLKRIDPNEIDYAIMKANAIQTELDRMMIVSYIHSKLDIVNYYISILESPQYSKKYNVPHSLDELYSIKKTLEDAKNKAMTTKFVTQKHFYVTYPDGYEG